VRELVVRRHASDRAVAVHVGYATDDFHALIDCDLLLPEKTRGADPELRETAGIPEGVNYRPKWRIAADLLKRTAADGMRVKSAVADEPYGRTHGFRQELAGADGRPFPRLFRLDAGLLRTAVTSFGRRS
jgi:SRSO17 transposase